MITEADRAKQTSDATEEQKKECLEIIRAAARYERLEANQDWLDIKKDMEKLIEIHQSQIEGYTREMVNASFFKRLKFMDIITIHQIRMDQLREAISYPEQIVFQAKTARDWMDQQRQKEAANV